MSGLQLVRHQKEQDNLIEARVKKAGDTMTGNLTMSGSAKVIGNLQGNADTATRLQTARNFSINGVSKSFNGSGNVAWTLAEIGVAPASHTHGSNTITAMTNYSKGTASTAITTGDSLNTAIGKLENKVDGKANSNHTHSNYLPLTGGTVTGSITVSGTITGNLSGNATTATRLQTARTINGVSFNGTQNITVADNTKLPLAGGTISGNILCNTNNSLRLGSSTARFHTLYARILDLSNETGVYPSGTYGLAFKCARQQGGEANEIFFSHNGQAYHFEPKWSGDVTLAQTTGLGQSNRKWRDVWSQAGTLQTSDISMKENVKKVVSEDDIATVKKGTSELSNVSTNSIFEAVKNIQPITFDYKGTRTVADNDKPSEVAMVGRQLGISAQELERLYPELFEYVGIKVEHENEDGQVVHNYSIKTLAYTNMLLVALQETMKKVEILEKELEKIKKN